MQKKYKYTWIDSYNNIVKFDSNMFKEDA